MIAGPFDLATLRAGYSSRRFTPVEIARETLRRLAAYPDPAVWITRVSEPDLMARAHSLAESGDGDAEALPLYGIPFAVKDNIDCAGVPTTAGCPEFAYTPAANAAVVQRLIDAGAMLVGKTNLDQFATGLVGTRSPYGAPRCVFDGRYVSGGSSSGSAIAVAAGIVAFALGTDTAGSGRVPAGYNNIVGLKPTRGLISARGAVPACRSLDCVSIFANTVGDAHSVLSIAEGLDAADDYSRDAAPRELPDRFRFGILAPADRQFFGNAAAAELYEAAISRLASCGGSPVEIDFAPFRDAGSLLYEGAWTAERLAAIKDFIAHHEDAMDPTVRQIISGARSLSAADAFAGQYRLASARRRAEKEWARMDVLFLPTVPGQDTVEDVNADPLARNALLGCYTNFVNLLDYCAIAVPAGFHRNRLAFGVTLIAPAFADASLADIADRFHRAGAFGMGAARDVSLPRSQPIVSSASRDMIELFVVGAHMSGMPLNSELLKLGAVFRREARTAADYRLYALPQTIPAKPGLVRVPGTSGSGIAGEIWAFPSHAFGRFVAAIPAPLGIGKIALDDGAVVTGFLCEAHAVVDAADITQFGGWRRYRESQASH